MQNFEAVRLHFEKVFIFSQLLPWKRPRRDGQPARGACFHFLQQRRHCAKIGERLKERKERTERRRNLVLNPVLDMIAACMSDVIDPDAALMLRVKQGDWDAFTSLVEKYKQPVMNLAYRTLSDATEAEDLAQHVFLQVFKSAPRYEASAKFSTWIFTITRNLCLNEIRRRTRHPAESLDETLPGHEDQPLRQVEDFKNALPPEALLQSELEEKVQLALSELPEKQRMALLLCRQDELSYEEIAVVLGCSLSATKSLIHRARESLKLALKPYLKTGQWREGRNESNFKGKSVI
jgi:RNA polymerase sigma-70 factor (ECF subfamily)